MSSPDEKSYWSDKVVKRGTVGKNPPSPSKIGSLGKHSDSLLTITTVYESKHESKASGGLLSLINHTNHRFGNRVGGLENWMPKVYILAIVSLLSILALSGSLVLVLSSRQSTESRDLTDGSSPFTGRLPTNLHGIARELDVREAAWTNEMMMSLQHPQQTTTCDPRFATLRVYMYDLPSEFHFGMLGGFERSPDEFNVWPRNLSHLPRYPGGLYQQHSPEYWIIADILTSNVPGRKHECTAVRVETPAEADVVLVPFFASLSYNKYNKPMEIRDGVNINEELQDKLVQYLTNQTAWQKSGGTNHIIVIHHPNSLFRVRDQLRSAMYVVCDFGRYSEETANMQKDIVAPYKHVIPLYKDDVTTFDSRTTLLFFQGAIVRKEGGVIRQQLSDLLKDEEGVHFVTGNTQSNGIRSATAGMRNSKFCLHLAGDTPSSNRLFDAIASHCVPVVISDEIELPFEDDLDYSEFCIFIRSTDALTKGFVTRLLRSIQSEEWTKMWLRLKEVAIHFDYQHPTKPTDAVNMLWQAIARRSPYVKFNKNRGKRYARSGWPHLILPQVRKLPVDDNSPSTTIGNDRRLLA